MKKIICIVICLSLMLSLNVCASEITKEQQEELKEYSIMVGDENGLRLEDNITKAEFSKMVLAARGIIFSFEKENLLGLECSFTDITKYDWQFQYINFSITMGYFKSENNISGADDEMTIEEAYNIIIDTLGYKSASDVEKENVKTAVFNNTDAEMSSILTRKSAAKIICNALDVPMMVMSGFDAETGAKYEILDGTDGKEKRTLRTDLDKIIEQENNN